MPVCYIFVLHDICNRLRMHGHLYGHTHCTGFFNYGTNISQNSSLAKLHDIDNIASEVPTLKPLKLWQL